MLKKLKVILLVVLGLILALGIFLGGVCYQKSKEVSKIGTPQMLPPSVNQVPPLPLLK